MFAASAILDSQRELLILFTGYSVLGCNIAIILNVSQLWSIGADSLMILAAHSK